MDSKLIAKAIAAGRVAFGLSILVAPRLVMGAPGRRAEGPLIWLARAFGVRDMVLGLGTLGALVRDDGSATTWVGLSAAADTWDAILAVAFREDLGPAFAGATLALAVPAAAGGWWAAISGA